MSEDSKLFNILVSQLGNGHKNLVELLLEKESFVSEEELADEVDLKVNEVRKILYKLYNLRYCEYKKTKKPNGWFVYFWKLRPNKIVEEFQNTNQEKLKDLQGKLKYERKHKFFKCGNGCKKLTYKEALETDFICPECEESLIYQDSNQRIQELEKEIKNLKKSFNF